MVIHFSSPEELVVLNVVNVPNLAYQSVWFRIKDLPLIVENKMRKEGEAVLEKITSELSPHVEAITTRMESGDPGEGILNVARNVARAAEIQLIILGARGLN